MDSTKNAAQQTPTAAPAPVQTAAPEFAVTGAGPAAAGSVGALQSLAGNRAVASILESGGHPLVQSCGASGAACGCEDEELVQREPRPGAADNPGSAAIHPSLLQAFSEGSGQRIDPGTRTFMESRFGRGFSGVRLHTGETAARAADAIDAQAFTVGSDIWFGRGFYRPGEPGGLHLLAHELTHTVQQGGRPVGAQARLKLGGLADTSESVADRAADAVMANTPVPRIGGGRVGIHRKPKVSAVPGEKNQRMVETDDGKKYRVTRHIVMKTDEVEVPDSGAPKFKPGIDLKNAWLEIEWCEHKKHEGTVKVGVNAPTAIKDLLIAAGKEVLAGRDPLAVLPQQKLEPFIEVVVTSSKKATVTGKVSVTTTPFDPAVTGGKVEGTVKTEKGEFFGNVQVEGPGQNAPAGAGATTTFNIGVRPGKKPKEVKCAKKKKVLVPDITYSCILQPTETEKKVPVPRTHVGYLYFKYAKDEWETRSSEPGGKRNPIEREGLKRVMGEGYKVTSIKGYASPEGPMDFNQPLSERRAAAALKWVEANCPKRSPLLVMRPEEEGCLPKDLKATGEGEIYSKSVEQGGKVVEAKGRPLAEHAVERFQEDPAEERHRTPDVEEELERRKTPEKQADFAYKLMRRAEVALSKTEMETKKVMVPERPEAVACPPEVKAAAEDDFEKTEGVMKGGGG